MKQEQQKLNYQAMVSIADARGRHETRCQMARRMITGRDQALLPDGWTDEDAWKLAGSLAKLMGQVKRARMTVFNEKNPYPGDGVSLEDIPYYNPADPTPPDTPEKIALWTDVLHCGILMTAGDLSFCSLFYYGIMADLEDLFTGTILTDGGPMIKFDAVLDRLRLSLSEERYRELEEGVESGDITPPVVSSIPVKGMEKPMKRPSVPHLPHSQNRRDTRWEEWVWLQDFPYLDNLRQAIERFKSDDLYDQVMDFIRSDVMSLGILSQAIDLYLYQTGFNMLDRDYFLLSDLLWLYADKILLAWKENTLQNHYLHLDESSETPF